MDYKITFNVGKTLAEIKECAALNMADWFDCIADARRTGEDVTEAQEIYNAWVDVYNNPVAYLPQNLSISPTCNPKRITINYKDMEALSEMTRNNMANYPDYLPTVMCYRELLAAACRKFGCKPDEAREKYGRLTNAEWSELLAA